MNLSDEEWKARLSPEQYKILREKGTEPPFTGALLDNKDDGSYVCAACGAVLFSSDHKFDSGSGWPSFYDVSLSDAVELHRDNAFGMERVEVTCKNCGGHLGHVFDDAYDQPTGKRYCINSMSLDFKQKS
jgi:peptide-methionine (R)-S-oxide reductase